MNHDKNGHECVSSMVELSSSGSHVSFSFSNVAFSSSLWFLTSSRCCLLCFSFSFLTWFRLRIIIQFPYNLSEKSNFLLWISKHSQSSQLLNFCSFFFCDLVGSSWCKAWWFHGSRLKLFDPSWAKIVEFLVQLSSSQTNYQFQLHLLHHFHSCTFLLQVKWAVCQTLTAILKFFLLQRLTDSFLLWPILWLEVGCFCCFDLEFSGHGFFLSGVTFHCQSLSQRLCQILDGKWWQDVLWNWCPGHAEGFCLAPRYKCRSSFWLQWDW